MEERAEATNRYVKWSIAEWAAFTPLWICVHTRKESLGGHCSVASLYMICNTNPSSGRSGKN